MSESLDATFFAGNRKRLKTLFVGKAPIVLTANGLLQRNGESTFSFRQDSSFWYLTGTETPDVILVMDKDREYLILPERNQSQTVMEGSLDYSEFVRTSGITEVLDYKAGWKQLTSRLKRVKHVATLAAAPAYVEHHGFYTNPARSALIERIRSINSQAGLLDIRPQLTHMRAIKQLPELAILRQTIDITGQALQSVRRKLPNYQYEYEIEADISRTYRLKRASGHGFEPIVANGKNATIPHYMANNDALSNKSLVVIDTGAELNNYTADITRTYSLTEPSKRQRDVFDAVLDVQAYALSKIKPGITIRNYEQLIELYMGEKLRKLGLIKSIDHKTVRKYYPHLTSHYLGLDVHDIGDYDQPLQANMVITVEPGIYIQKESLGVRIEDDVLITKDGVEVLSTKAPQQLW